MTESKIHSLVDISHTLGDKVAYVQGGGGNTSIKLDDTRMAIKASGGLLKDMSIKDGYSVVDYPSIRDYLITPDLDEDVFTQKIKSFVLETDNRPSIETGFHALLGTCVIHTHSVYANLLTCSQEGEEIASKLFPNSLWIEYETPGRDLTLAMQNRLKESHIAPNVIFLQNHGLITIGNTAQDTLDLHKAINQSIQEYCKLSPVEYHTEYSTSTLDMEFIKTHVCFPDQVVYTLAGQALLETQAAKETLWAYTFIVSNINNLNLTPQFIAQDKAEILLHMESEKYRQGMLNK